MHIIENHQNQNDELIILNMKKSLLNKKLERIYYRSAHIQKNRISSVFRIGSIIVYYPLSEMSIFFAKDFFCEE